MMSVPGSWCENVIFGALICVSGWPPDPAPLQEQPTLGIDLPDSARLEPPPPPRKGRASSSEQSTCVSTVSTSGTPLWSQCCV